MRRRAGGIDLEPGKTYWLVIDVTAGAAATVLVTLRRSGPR